MSNVYKRNRTQSPLDVINKSKELLKDTYQIIMNENKVPKKHRYFIGKTLYNSANKIVCCTFCANNIFPKSKEDLLKRKMYQNDALYECALFLNLLDTYSDMLANLSYKDAQTSYQSWRGYAAKKNAYNTIKSMDKLFNELFINNWINLKP